MRNLRYLLDELNKSNYGGRKSDFDPLARKKVMIGHDVHAATPGQHPISKDALSYHLHKGSYSLLSAANPLGADGEKNVVLSPEENKARMDMMKKELKAKGAIWHEAKGIYRGNPEPSLMVHHMGDVTKEYLEGLANRFGQESILHSTDNNHTFKFVNGPNKGLHHKGSRHRISSDLQNIYTQMSGMGRSSRFLNDIDFKNFHKNDAKYYHILTDDGQYVAVHHHIDRSKLH